MAGLKVVLQTLDDVEDSLQQLYALQKIKDREGKDVEAYVLDIEGLEAGAVLPHPVVRNLTTAHQKATRDKQALSARIQELQDKYKDLPEDFSPERLAELERENAELKEHTGEPDPKRREEAANARRMQEQKHANELKKKEDRVKQLEGELAAEKDRNERNIIDASLTDALTKAGVTNPRFMKAAKAMLRQDVKVDRDDEEIKPVIDGVDIEQYVADWAASDDGREFVEKPKGGDAKPGNGKISGENPWSEAQWNSTKQDQLIASNPSRAQQLMQQAGYKSQDLAIKAGAEKRKLSSQRRVA